MSYSGLFWILGSLFGFLGVAFGAFGAHALRAVLPVDLMTIFETGVRYQMYHALALFVAAIAAAVRPSKLTMAAGWFFIFGITVFSGTLYLLALTGSRWLGAITPIGGAALLGGWACLGISGWRQMAARKIEGSR